ncbi:uncharacterized protein [Choristoneura fumiferana]|uniref:uncharacterized protein n=1 Tax=Choristoneura fumiferana TaxID=7141 RepID=UPI003D15C9D1
MTKFFVALLVVSLLAFVSASDDDDDSGLSSLFGFDDGVFGFLKPIPSLGADFAKKFKPPPGGHGSAHYSSTSHDEKTVNGEKVQDETKSDQVDNINGAVVNEAHTST